MNFDKESNLDFFFFLWGWRGAGGRGGGGGGGLGGEGGLGGGSCAKTQKLIRSSSH